MNRSSLQDLVIHSHALGGDREGQTRTVRIVCLSDTHDLHHMIVLPPADILIHCGDFSTRGNIFSIFRFRDFLQAQKHIKHKIVIPGNHELYPDITRRILKNYCTYLLNEMTTAEGIKIYGCRYRPSWSLPIGHDRFAQRDWSHIPKDIDILVTHQPPKGRGDTTGAGVNRGNVTLMAEIRRRVKPAVHLFGHNHEGYGIHPEDVGVLHDDADIDETRVTTFIGCAIKVMENTVREPIIFDYVIPAHRDEVLLSAKTDEKTLLT